ncbi:hypothetical protein Pint_27239 [Pistacia integerrima]|uniref:Uncharacterized protein n=1 Tax=Pistacia integerrima TaxID=434235 RepID=A0ACC0YRI1_9ROSI|nr:hypothetical protein Pint_27239 [Pistacia integerrima]
MLNYRGTSHHYNSRSSSSSSTLKFLSKKPSFFTSTLYVLILLFASSILLFLVSTRNILNDGHDYDEKKNLFTQHSQSQSQSRSESQSQSQSLQFVLWELDYWVQISVIAGVARYCVMIPDDQLWNSPFSYGLHSCVKPTSKYKGKSYMHQFLYSFFCYVVWTIVPETQW